MTWEDVREGLRVRVVRPAWPQASGRIGTVVRMGAPKRKRPVLVQLDGWKRQHRFWPWELEPVEGCPCLRRGLRVRVAHGQRTSPCYGWTGTVVDGPNIAARWMVWLDGPGMKTLWFRPEELELAEEDGER